MQNSTQKNNLQKYSAFALAVLAGGATTAQVVYTDVDPDEVVDSNEVYTLDLNNDLMIDFFVINDKSDNFYFADILGYGIDNSVVGYSAAVYAYNLDFLSVLDEGAVIGPSQNFVGAFGGILFSSLFPEPNGAWIDETNKFAGVKFKIGSETHYGWLLLDAHLATPAQIILKGFAYEETPDTPISTIDLGDAIISQKPNAQIYYSLSYLNIVLPVLEENAAFKIYDLTGRLIQTEQISNISTKQLISGLTSGIYLVQVINGNNTHTETVLIN